MKNIRKLGCLLGVVAMLAVAATAEARLSGNRLSGNKLSSNKLSSNTVAANTMPGDGAFTDVYAVELADGVRLSR